MPEIPFESIESLFKSNYHRFYGLAFNLVRDKEAAKDIVQDVFFKIWKNQDYIDFSNRTVGYFLTATTRTALTYIRDNKRFVNFESQSGLVDRLKSSTTIDDIYFTDLEHHVQKAIDRLPSKCRTIFILSRKEGLKYSEIADTLNLSLKTVENQMGIALHRLREDLRPYITSGLVFVVLALLIELSLFLF